MPALRLRVGPFGVKDLFTIVNLLGGIAGIYFVLDGQAQLAGFAVFAGYLFGDTLDGPVARLTRTSNKFGSEFDTATDHFGQAIVPSIIVFAVYAQHGHRTAGAMLMAVIVIFATIRQALFTVARIGDPLTYCGLPRTVSGYACMSFVLSHGFATADGAGFVVGEVLIPALSVMGVLPIPYMTHRGTRRMQTWVKVLVVSFLLVPAAVFVLARAYTFDLVFAFTFGYALFAWFPLTSEERAAFFKRYREWTVEVNRT